MSLAQSTFPGEGVLDDCVQVGIARHPGNCCLDPAVVEDQRIRVAGAAAFEPAVDLLVGYAVDRVEHFEDQEPALVAAVHGQRPRWLGNQRLERQNVGIGKVGDMYVVAHPGTVRCIEIGAEYPDMAAFAQCRLDRDVEVAQRALVEGMRFGDVSQHELSHELGHSVRIDRRAGACPRSPVRLQGCHRSPRSS